MTSHALLSPSAAHRWMACEASVLRAALFPDTTSVHAERGSALHEARAKYLVGTANEADTDFLLKEGFLQFSEPLKTEMLLSDFWAVERPLDISKVTGEKGAKGTPDLVMVRGTTLVIEDLKTGFVPVSPVGNFQLLIYAAAALAAYDPAGFVDAVKLAITSSSGVECANYTVPEVRNFSKRVKKTGRRIIKGENLKATPGAEQCRYCRAASSCKELEYAVLAKISEKDFKVATDTEINERYKCLDLVDWYVKQIRQEMAYRLNNGVDMPDYELAEGRQGNRKWSDVDAVVCHAEALGCSGLIYEQSVMSPTALARMRGQELMQNFERFIVRDEGKPKIEVKGKGKKIDVKNLIEYFENLES